MIIDNIHNSNTDKSNFNLKTTIPAWITSYIDDATGEQNITGYVIFYDENFEIVTDLNNLDKVKGIILNGGMSPTKYYFEGFDPCPGKSGETIKNIRIEDGNLQIVRDIDSDDDWFDIDYVDFSDAVFETDILTIGDLPLLLQYS